MKIALVPATSLRDPTYGRVCRGLARALAGRGRAARAFDPRDAERLRRFSPDVVHAHFSGRLPAASRALFARAAREGARLVLTFQDLDHPNHPRRTDVETRGVAALVRAARRVTALTPRLARAVLAAYPAARGKLSVVGNGVGPEWFAPPGAGRGGIAAAARLSPYKGVDLLLWAFRGLLDREPRARLVVCGRDFSNGHYQELARRLGLSERVRFLGEVGERRLRRELSRSRFFVSASRAETYGLAALEAMASGRAVLSSRTGAARTLAHGREAWLVPPGDWRALERGMLRLWRDAALRRRLARGGRRLAAAGTWDDRARRYERIYRCA
jgi:glycosyltransferase involved in cell wall biosynthesis